MKPPQLQTLVREQLSEAAKFVCQIRKKHTINACIGTGGNFESLGKLRVSMLNKSSVFSLNSKELALIIDKLAPLSLKERIEKLDLREDRADVILPAAMIIECIMHAANSELLQIPFVGLRDGILAELSQNHAQPRRA